MTRRLAAVALGLLLVLGAAPDALAQQLFGEDVEPGGEFPSGGQALTSYHRFSRQVRNQKVTSFETPSDGQAAPLELDLVGPSGRGSLRIVGSGRVSSAAPGARRFPRTGQKLWETTLGDFTITFGKPVAAFAFFATDVGDEGGKLRLVVAREEGSTRTIQLENSTWGSPGSALFFGLISRSESYTSVTFQTTARETETIGIDDLIIGDPR
jgi:hypothetical protein